MLCDETGRGCWLLVLAKSKSSMPLSQFTSSDPTQRGPDLNGGADEGGWYLALQCVVVFRVSAVYRTETIKQQQTQMQGAHSRRRALFSTANCTSR